MRTEHQTANCLNSNKFWIEKSQDDEKKEEEEEEEEFRIRAANWLEYKSNTIKKEKKIKNDMDYGLPLFPISHLYK